MSEITREELKDKMVTILCYLINDYTDGDPGYISNICFNSKIMPLIDHYTKQQEIKALNDVQECLFNSKDVYRYTRSRISNLTKQLEEKL